jgi:type I restriction enzyme, S subunit
VNLNAQSAVSAIVSPGNVPRLRKLLVKLTLMRAGTSTAAQEEIDASTPEDDLDVPSQLEGVGLFVRLSEIAEVTKGPTGIKDARPGPYPLVVTAEERGTCDHYDFEGEAVLIPTVSSTGHGDASLKRIHYQEGRFAVGSILAAVRVRDRAQHSARFLYEYLSVFKDELLVARMSGTANVSLTVNKIEGVPIPIVPIAQQQELRDLMHLCDALEAKGRLEAEQHARLLGTLLGTLTDSSTPEELAANWQRVADHFDLLLDRPEAVDALEQTILQLAVRGLLVPQDASEEPANQLLDRIRAEKHRLATAGKIRRDLQRTEISNEEMTFDLPIGWAWVRWHEIALSIGDIDHKMPAEVTDGVPYVSPRDFFGVNEIDFEGAKKISRSDFDELARKTQPTAGDLIYPRYGTIGNVRLVTTERDFLASYSCAVIKVLPGFVEHRFQHIMSVSGYVRQQAAAATNKTTQPNVGLKSIQNFVLALPPLAEQARIVARVTELRRLCADLRQRLATSQTIQSHLAEALVESPVA